MKFKVTKNEKELYEKLTNLAEKFESNEETVLSIYALGNNFGESIFTGESWKLTQGFYEILKKGLNKKNANDDFTLQITCSILDAIAVLAHEHSEEAQAFADLLTDIYVHANGENEDEDVEIEVTDENDEPTEKKEETLEELAAKLDKMGYYISKKPQKKTSATQPKSKK